MAPVVLKMDVHCNGCSEKIWKALRTIAGVESVSSSWETNRVVVEGSADPDVLKTRLETKMRKSVTIESSGVDAPPPSRRAPSRRAPSRRAPSPPNYPPPSPPRYRPRTSPPNYPPPSPPRYRPPTSPPNYPPPPPPPRSGYSYDNQYGGNGYSYDNQYGGNGYSYDNQYGGNGYSYDNQYGGNGYSYVDNQYGGNGYSYVDDNQYGGNGYPSPVHASVDQYASSPRRPHYMLNDAPPFFSDENPNACSIQ